MNNGVKMTVKILLIEMMATFYKKKGEGIIQYYEG